MDKNISKLDQYLLVSFLCLPMLVVFVMGYTGSHWYQYDVVRWAEIVALVLVNGLLVLRCEQLRFWFVILNILFFFNGATRSFSGADPAFTHLAVGHWTLLAGLMVAVLYLWANWFGRVFLIAVAVFGGYLTFVGILNFIYGVSTGLPISRDIVSPFGENIRFFNQLQVFIIPVFYVYSVLGEKRYRFFSWSIVALNVYFCVFLGARGLAVALFSMALFLSLSKCFRKPFFIFISLCLCAYGLNAITLSSQVNESILRGASSGRLEIWWQTLVGMDVWGWLVGQGAGSYALQQFTAVAHPHNALIHLLYEFGVFIAGFALVISVWVLRSMILARDRFLGVVESTYMAGFFCACVYALFSGVIVMPLPQILFVVFFAVSTRIAIDNSPWAEKRLLLFSKLRWNSWLASVAVYMITLSLYLPAAYLTFKEHQEIPDRYHRPGFWLNGKPPWALQ